MGVEKTALDQRDLDLGAHARDDVVELGGVVCCRSALEQVASLDRSSQKDISDRGLASAFDDLGVRAERGRTLLGQDVRSVSRASAILEFPGVEGPPLIPGMHSFVLLGSDGRPRGVLAKCALDLMERVHLEDLELERLLDDLCPGTVGAGDGGAREVIAVRGNASPFKGGLDLSDGVMPSIGVHPAEGLDSVDLVARVRSRSPLLAGTCSAFLEDGQGPRVIRGIRA